MPGPVNMGNALPASSLFSPHHPLRHSGLRLNADSHCKRNASLANISAGVRQPRRCRGANLITKSGYARIILSRSDAFTGFKSVWRGKNAAAAR